MFNRNRFVKSRHPVLLEIGVSFGIGIFLFLFFAVIGAAVLLLTDHPTRAAGGVMLAVLLLVGLLHGFLISGIYDAGTWSGRIGALAVGLLLPIGSLIFGGNIGGGFLNALIYCGAAMLASFLPKKRRR